MRSMTFWLWVATLHMCSSAQPVSFGLKGGLPLTNLLVPPAATQRINNGFTSLTETYATQTRPYTVGPTVQVRLPLRLAVEFDALYKHFNYDHNTANQNGPLHGNDLFQYQKVAVGRWEFPLLLKYSPWRRRFSPFIAGGPSLSYVARTAQSVETITQVWGSIGGSPRVISVTDTVTSSSARPKELVRTATGGATFDLGGDFRALRRLRFSADLRYTRWLNRNFRSEFPALPFFRPTPALALGSKQDQLEFLLGVTF